MNQNPTPRWSPMVSGPDDDFANFLDFTDLGFGGYDAVDLQQNGAGAMETSMDGTAGMLGLEQGHMQQQPSAMDQQNHLTPINGFHGSTESFPDLAMQQDLFDQQQQQQQLHMQNHGHHGQIVVPPTPSSLEMHAGHAQYYRTPADHQQLHMYDQYRRNQKDQMIFTPLVSPAVTPLDTQFQYPDYAAPTDAFSPLTSPALRAQNQAAQHSVYGAVRGSDTSDTTSPIDPSLEFSAPTSASTAACLRKSKRKTSSSSTKNPTRAVRQSPAMRPQNRKKQPSSTVIPPKEISGIIEEARRSNQANNAQQTADGKLHLPYGQDSSGPDSVSPEPLSEILMPPPATPKSSSASKSPYINAKQNGHQAGPLDTNGEPATPASLMKIRKQARKANGMNHTTSSLKEQTALAEADMEQIMEDIVLPEPANTARKPALKPINTAYANTDQSTPTMGAPKTPKYGPSSAPITANTSAFPSPQLVASPTSAGAIKRVDSRLKSRDLKKRNSQSSVHISPALRPKISPSIKPLLPEGAIVSAETSALLLASKSNYQNILEGTHLPGVSYPETLSTNLTSKRTSHKIAEQGRRNRINTALQEIASLLPPTTPQVNGQSGGMGGTSPSLMMSGTLAQQSNSKASTVELAIEYIKSLQKELRETKEKLQTAETENEAGKDKDKDREKGDSVTNGDMEAEAT